MTRWFPFHSPLARLGRQRQIYWQQWRDAALPQRLRGVLGMPLPHADTPVDELDYLVLDLETSGLDPHQDHILSLGLLALTNGKMCMETAQTLYVRAPDKVKAQSAVINHITPEMLVRAQPLDEAMDTLFHHLAGKVLLVHGAGIELGFLDAYLARRHGLPAPPLLCVDTLQMEKGRLQGREEHWASDYRLAAVRERLGLPPYPGHSALEDALATGELFLALSKKIHGRRSPTLAQFYRGAQGSRYPG